MKNKYRILTLLIVAAFAILSVTASIVIGASAKSKPSITSSSIICSYFLKEYNGYLAIFKEGTDKPLRTLDVSIDILPERDQETIRNGIKANSLEEILAIAEDYDG